MNVLQVILGDASMVEAAPARRPATTRSRRSIRKLVLGNNETMELLRQEGHGRQPRYRQATAENAFLTTLLPKTLSVEEIKAALAEVADAIKGAKNDGQATGVAMKHLKSKNLKVQGEDVSAAVRALRS